jgi:hypothetical protein
MCVGMAAAIPLHHITMLDCLNCAAVLSRLPFDRLPLPSGLDVSVTPVTTVASVFWRVVEESAVTQQCSSKVSRHRRPRQFRMCWPQCLLRLAARLMLWEGGYIWAYLMHQSDIEHKVLA